MKHQPHHIQLWRALRQAAGKQPTVCGAKFGEADEPFDVATATDTPRKGVSLYATLKLSDGFAPTAAVRFELAAACRSENKKFSDVLMFAAHLALAEPSRFLPGAVLEKLVSTRYSRATAAHILVTSRPLLGMTIPDIEREDGGTLGWSYLIPITSEELLAVQRGNLSVAELENVLADAGGMLFDLDRESMV